MRIVRAADHRRMRWKNGLGETIEFAISPQGATIDAFDWRLSRASVNASGSFSLFPECDRTLCLITGGPMKLDISGDESIILDSNSGPYTFAADIPAQATLLGEPVSDLNMIWRRGGLTPQLTRHSDTLQARLDNRTLIFVAGQARLEYRQEFHDLAANDLVICESNDRISISPQESALYSVTIPHAGIGSNESR